MWKYFCTRGQLKKKKKENKVPNQRHVCKFAELDEGGGYSEIK